MNDMNAMQKEILFNWGTPAYEDTLDRLYQVRRLTVDYRYRDQITMLICRLLELNSSFEYEHLFFLFRTQVEQEIEKMRKEKTHEPDEV